jgi:hypothetical protein
LTQRAQMKPHHVFIIDSKPLTATNTSKLQVTGKLQHILGGLERMIGSTQTILV